jgi:hypothetical protein
MSDVTGNKAITNAVLSPNVELAIGQFTIGYARQVTETQARDVAPVYEIGTVGIVEMAPGQPKPVTLALEHVAIYGATMVNIVALAIASGNMAGISAAAGLTSQQTVAALTTWLQALGTTMSSIFDLAHMPIGFLAKVYEQSPVDPSAQMITTYNNCWITRYTRPIKATGDLLVVETMDISAQSTSTAQSKVAVTQNQIAY